MVDKVGLRHRIAGEFASGLSSADELSAVLSEVNSEPPDLYISPKLAADFEQGLESEIGDLCGCGCGHSGSGSSLKKAADSCSSCHNCHQNG